VFVRLTKEERSNLWTILQSTTFQPFQLEALGTWRFSSQIAGPHLWIVGSVHGNEAVGAVVLEKLMKLAIKGHLLSSGTVTFVLGNPTAFLEDLRYIDQDLNRAFSQQTIVEGNVELNRQAELHRLLKDHPPQFVLDLHSVSSGDHGIVVYPKESEKWAERLGCLETHFCYSQEHMAGETLIDAAQSYGAGVMVVECGHHHSSNTIDVALAHIQKLLHYFEISSHPLIDIEPSTPSVITRYRSTQMIKPHLGFKFSFPVETGSEVNKGVTYAVDKNGAHIAPHHAWFMMPSLEVKPHDQDAGWLCSRELIS
jgi:succinylglutamate desuccinylase